MGLPQINIAFSQLAISLAQRSTGGIVALILKDTTNLGLNQIYKSADIPATLSAENKNYIEMALMGNVNVPNKIIIYTIGGTDTLANALAVLETQDFNYLVMPSAVTLDKTTIQTWVTKMRDTDKVKVKAILGDTVSNYEGIINFATSDIKIDAATYTSDKFAPRIAGIITGTPLSQSITYTKLNEITSIPVMARVDANTAIDAGKLILVKEAGAIRIGRGVNSLTTVGTKGDLYKKIKIVDILDLIHTDCRKVIIDEYIGKVPNNYDNKCLLIVEIQEYLKELAKEQLIQTDFEIGMDLVAQEAYLKSKNIDVNAMSEKEIKEANTGSSVFLKGSVKVLDSVEDVDLNFVF
jgi:hypothetical protein